MKSQDFNHGAVTQAASAYITALMTKAKKPCCEHLRFEFARLVGNSCNHTVTFHSHDEAVHFGLAMFFGCNGYFHENAEAITEYATQLDEDANAGS